MPNSEAAVRARVAAGAIGWPAVLLVSFARLGFALVAQGVTAGVLAARGVERPFVAAADWFTVHGTLVDLGTLALLAWLLRREGLSVADLFRARSVPFGRSLLLAPVMLVGLGAVGFAGAAVTGLVVYGTPLVPPPMSPLPLWAALYSALVWPLVWGFVEEAAYNGYAAPRAQALGGTLAVAVVCLGWAAQHLALPLRFDAAFLAVRFFPSLGVAIAAVAVYLRTRNLLPLAIAHWLIDAASGALTFG